MNSITKNQTFGSRIHPAKFLFAIFLSIGLVTLGAFSSGMADILPQLINFARMFIILFLPIALLWIAFPVKYMFRMLAVPFSQSPKDSRLAPLAVHFYRSWTSCILASGFIATIVGLMKVMTVLDQPEQIGPGIAVAFLGTIIALFFVLAITFPFTKVCESIRFNYSENPSQELVEITESVGKFGFFRTVFGVLLAFFVFTGFMFAIGAGDLLGQLFNLGSIFMISAGLVAGAWMTSGKDVPSFFKLIRLKKFEKRETFAALRKIEAMQIGAVCAALFGTVVGLMKVMTVLDQPEMIGPGIAVAFIVSFMGVFSFAVCSSLGAYYRMQIGEDDKQENALIAFIYGAKMSLLFALFVVLFSLKKDIC